MKELKNKVEEETMIPTNPLDEEPLRKITNRTVILLVILCTGLAIYAYQGYLNPTYTFIPEEFTGGGAVIGDVINGKINSVSVENLNLQITYTTTSLSAQNSIKVNAKFYPPTGAVIDSYQWNNVFPPHYYLVFRHSLMDNDSLINSGHYYEGTVELSKSIWGQEYDGDSSIKYQFEGDYNFSLIDQPTMDSHRLTDGMEMFNDTTLNLFSVKGSNIHVGSSNDTTNLHASSIGLCLTFVLIGFGIVETKKHIQSIWKSYFAWRINRKKIQGEGTKQNS